MQPPADDHPLAPNTGRLAGMVRVVSFDCFSNKEGKRDASMRAWNAGGPSGAVWNIDGAPLVCKVTLDAPCGGSTELLLFGNRTALGKAVFNVTEGRSNAEMAVPTHLWERAEETGKLNFATLLISVGGILVCGDDFTSVYPFADAFIAGIAVGE